MSGRAIKAKCWIITTIKAEADIRGQVKYDLADCKITEGENALSVLADKRQTQEKWMDGMMSEDRIWVTEIFIWSVLSHMSHMIIEKVNPLKIQIIYK